MLMEGKYALSLQSFREAMALYDHGVIDYEEFSRLINECREMLGLKSIEDFNLHLFHDENEHIESLKNRIFVLERELEDMKVCTKVT